ncbi:MAG: glycosyltransferase [Lachnospiraceae bacterium]|nr:glycosyltransferase [Lachnospiraceae bacterium]
MEPFFSIIIVCFQAGEELGRTVESVRMQTDGDFEILVKDGGSTDGSIGHLPEDSRIRLFQEKDSGIYDAMNQAAGRVRGQYVLFLNCGDYLYDKEVLAGVRKAVRESAERTSGGGNAVSGLMPVIFYGNTYERKTQSVVMSNPKLDAFGCYRNIPCHQSCFYPAELIRPEQLHKRGRERTYEPHYRVRADYEHFLWCFFRAKAQTVYVPLTICSYEGGGFSESKENRAAAKEEHRAITALYMTRKERLRYRAILLLTLAPLRTYLARSRWFSGIYQGVKRMLYRRRAH